MRHLFALAVVLCFAACSLAAIPAFPGAAGGGAVSVGGRGGRVIEVTNLEDDGPGSLRAACSAAGPRIVVFRVAGVITLNSTINIREPYLTIAGQTAPGGGIVLTTKNKRHDGVVVYANDVIIRFIRIRDMHDGISVKEGGYNVMVDHCSFSWGRDENMSANGPAHDLTYSWIITAECLLPHSCGVLIKGGETFCPEMVNVDLERNLFMNNWNRNPRYNNLTNGQFINNIIFNWVWYGGSIGSPHLTEMDFVGNLYKVGPSFLGEGVEAYPKTGFTCSKAALIIGDKPKIYIRGNKGPTQTDPDADNWGMMERIHKIWIPTGTQPSRENERFTPQPRTYPIRVEHVNDIEKSVLPDVGASRRLDENGKWVSNRDSVDERLIRDYQAGVSKAIHTPNEVGGMPAIAAGEPYADADHDGMPDAWEVARKLDPAKDDSAADRDGDGYTNIEEFINSPLN